GATVVVARANTSTTVTAMTGGPFTAVVSPVAPGGGTPTGAVRFLHDGQAIGTAPLVPMGAASAATIAVTSQIGNITAEYAGDATYPAASATFTQVVSATPVTLILTASDEAPVYGQAVTLTAQVAGSGTVQFTDGGSVIGSAALVSGAARITVSTLAAGPH